MNHMPVNGLMPPTCRACRGPSYKRFGSVRVASAVASPLVNWGSSWQFWYQASSGSWRQGETTMPIPALLPGAEFFVIASTDFLVAWGQSGLVGCCDFWCFCWGGAEWQLLELWSSEWHVLHHGSCCLLCPVKHWANRLASSWAQSVRALEAASCRILRS